MKTPTAAMRETIEAAGFQFLKSKTGWALFDIDDRSEVPGTRAGTFGNSIWASATALGLDKIDGAK